MTGREASGIWRQATGVRRQATGIRGQATGVRCWVLRGRRGMRFRHDGVIADGPPPCYFLFPNFGRLTPDA
jgi:hypothetical protein